MLMRSMVFDDLSLMISATVVCVIEIIFLRTGKSADFDFINFL